MFFFFMLFMEGEAFCVQLLCIPMGGALNQARNAQVKFKPKVDVNPNCYLVCQTIVYLKFFHSWFHLNVTNISNIYAATFCLHACIQKILARHPSGLGS